MACVKSGEKIMCSMKSKAHSFAKVWFPYVWASYEEPIKADLLLLKWLVNGGRREAVFTKLPTDWDNKPPGRGRGNNGGSITTWWNESSLITKQYLGTGARWPITGLVGPGLFARARRRSKKKKAWFIHLLFDLFLHHTWSASGRNVKKKHTNTLIVKLYFAGKRKKTFFFYKAHSICHWTFPQRGSYNNYKWITIAIL